MEAMDGWDGVLARRLSMGLGFPMFAEVEFLRMNERLRWKGEGKERKGKGEGCFFAMMVFKRGGLGD